MISLNNIKRKLSRSPQGHLSSYERVSNYIKIIDNNENRINIEQFSNILKKFKLDLNDKEIMQIFYYQPLIFDNINILVSISNWIIAAYGLIINFLLLIYKIFLMVL